MVIWHETQSIRFQEASVYAAPVYALIQCLKLKLDEAYIFPGQTVNWNKTPK